MNACRGMDTWDTYPRSFCPLHACQQSSPSHTHTWVRCLSTPPSRTINQSTNRSIDHDTHPPTLTGAAPPHAPDAARAAALGLRRLAPADEELGGAAAGVHLAGGEHHFLPGCVSLSVFHRVGLSGWLVGWLGGKDGLTLFISTPNPNTSRTRTQT